MVDIGAIRKRFSVVSDAYFDHLAPRCSYHSQDGGFGCGLTSGHDGAHCLMMPTVDGWHHVGNLRADLAALLAELSTKDAEIAELRATIENERGEGMPPRTASTVPNFLLARRNGIP